MAKQTGKGRPNVSKGSRGRKEAAFERHAAGQAMHQNKFVGDADADRAGTEFLKADQKAAAEESQVVHEMTDTLEKEAGLKTDGVLHAPRSIKDGVEMLNTLRSVEGREELREKARERLEALPAPVQSVMHRAERLAGFVTAPLQRGVKFVSEMLRVPGALFRILTHREA